MKKKTIFSSAMKSSLKVIPLAVAVSMIYAGTAFGAEKTFEVQLQDGSIARFDAKLMRESKDYELKVKQSLEYAFNQGKSLYIQDDGAGSPWIDFGANAHGSVTYSQMLSNVSSYAATPASSDYDLYSLDHNGAVIHTHY